jgi:hypothetical protein
MLSRAAFDDFWDVFMIAFRMMHQSARNTIFPLTSDRRIGTLLMFAVRSIFANPERVAVAMREATEKGQVEKWLGQKPSQEATCERKLCILQKEG